ncbi:MAG: hypothetical protein Q7W44_02965 [Coriobacteriia bacterium]|nr:hypothetical protein [Coriobacteriia bacterium]
MEVKLFVRQDCPGCAAAAHACEGLTNLSVYDIGEIEGIAAASPYAIKSAPSIVVVDSAGREIAGWRGEAPDPADLRAVVAN